MNKNNDFGIKKVCLIGITAGMLSACGSSDDNSSSSSVYYSSNSSSSINAVKAVQRDGYVELSDGRGGVTYESVNYPEVLGFDKDVSLAAFKNTLYPLLRANCAGCHSTENTSGSGAQAPLHADKDAELAHEHALTKVNFHDVSDSILSTRLWIDRHNCFASSCADSAEEIDQAIMEWKSRIASMLPNQTYSTSPEILISDQQVSEWIAEDRANTPEEDREFIQYASFHVLHNEGVSALDLNLARVALSKALNSVARWAPEVVNPTPIDLQNKVTDVDKSEVASEGKEKAPPEEEKTEPLYPGIVYRFDIRDYWGVTKIDTSSNNYKLFFGGSDDDLAFGNKIDINGDPVSFNDLGNMQNRLRSSVAKDEDYARLAWQRILYGNIEGSGDNSTLPPNIKGFVGKRSIGASGQEYIKAEDLEYVEATQLIFTLTRPDVYNSIMAIPGYSHWLEDELGVDKSAGMDSFDYMIQYEAASIDSRLYYRAKQNTGKNDYYWKTFDTFATGLKDIDDIYAAEEQNSPFWEAPIPVFISAGGGGGTNPSKLTMIALRNLGPGGSNGGGFYEGTDSGSQFGGQQSFELLTYSLPNGLQGYAVYGGFNQRRTDVFTNTIRDPRLLRDVADDVLDDFAGYGFPRGVEEENIAGYQDIRLNLGSSCIGCHADGMKRGNNNMRDWLDENPSLFPSGDHGVDVWIGDSEYVSRVRELYKPSHKMRRVMEQDRRTFLQTMGKIQKGMIVGPDKNVYQEPVIWSIEWAKKYYQFPLTRST